MFVNIGLLFYFKYCNFFIENVNALLSGLKVHQLQLLKVVLPIGISFYTFETITYLLDFYRKLHKLLLMLQENKDPEAIEKATMYISVLTKRLS